MYVWFFLLLLMLCVNVCQRYSYAQKHPEIWYWKTALGVRVCRFSVEISLSITATHNSHRIYNRDGIGMSRVQDVPPTHNAPPLDTEIEKKKKK